MLVWLSPSGHVLGHATDSPSLLLQQAAACLQDTIERPMFGRPHRPTHVRVASEALALTLRESFPDLEVDVAPTPEFDTLMETVRRDMVADKAQTFSYLEDGVDAESVAACCRATAALYRVKPWKLVPDDHTFFSLTSARLGMQDVVVSVIGQLGKSMGMLMFESVEDYDAYSELAAAQNEEADIQIPPHLILNYEGRSTMTPGLYKDIKANKWEIGGPQGYP